MNGIRPNESRGGPIQMPSVGSASIIAQTASPKTLLYLPCCNIAVPPPLQLRIVLPEISHPQSAIHNLKSSRRCHCRHQFRFRRHLKTTYQELRLEQAPQERRNNEAAEKTHNED